MSKNKKKSTGEKVRLMQVPKSTVPNARITVIENTTGFDDAGPGHLSPAFVKDVLDMLDTLGIGRDIEVDVAG